MTENGSPLPLLSRYAVMVDVGYIYAAAGELLFGTSARRDYRVDAVGLIQAVTKHADELFTFLKDAQVPADNNGAERDIRSLAAARNDGGTHRAPWSTAAFARLKSVIATGMKNSLRFAHYGIDVVRAKLQGEPLPLPLVLDTG